MLRCQLSSKHVWCYSIRSSPQLSIILDVTVLDFVLDFQTCLMLCWKFLSLTFNHLGLYMIVRCKILSLTFNHLGWHAVRPVLNFQSSWVLRCQVLSPTFKHVGWYTASSRPCRTKTRTRTVKTKLKFWLRCFFLQPIYWWSTSKLRRAWFIKFDIGMTMEFEPPPVKIYPLHQWLNAQ